MSKAPQPSPIPQTPRNPDVKLVPIDLIHPWKENPRIVKKGDYERLKAQILELGFYKALLATEDLEAPGHFIVLGGNTRLRALKDLGWTEVGLTIVNAPTESQRLKYNLSDNDEVGSWDDQALAEIAFRTKDAIHNLEIFKIDLGARASLPKLMDAFGPSEASDEDMIPEPQQTPITRPGQLFHLGPHALLCGDATNPQHYTRLLGQGGHADLIFTDPPYNMNYRSHKLGGIENDNMAEEEFANFAEAFWTRFKEALKEGGAFYVCSGYGSLSPFLYALKKNGLVYGATIAWIKPAGGLGWQDYRRQHELVLQGTKKGKRAQPILYGWREGQRYFFDTRLETDVWEIGRRAGATMLHPTQKPLALVQRAIRNSSRPGELVLDPFAGSGSTLIAADREGRKAALIELDPVYCDVIIRRWAAQGAQTEAEIRAGAEEAQDSGCFRGQVRRTRKGQGKGKGQAEIEAPRGKTGA